MQYFEVTHNQAKGTHLKVAAPTMAWPGRASLRRGHQCRALEEVWGSEVLILERTMDQQG